MLVTAPEAVRRKRVAAKLTESQFTHRAERQIDENEKAAGSDFVFDNRLARRLKQFVAESMRASSPAAAGGRKADGGGAERAPTRRSLSPRARRRVKAAVANIRSLC